MNLANNQMAYLQTILEDKKADTNSFLIEIKHPLDESNIAYFYLGNIQETRRKKNNFRCCQLEKSPN